MKEFLSKLTSRKFIASIIGVIVGIAVVFGVDGNTITDVAGVVTALASLVTYIVSEGMIDAAAVQSAIYTLVDDSDSVTEMGVYTDTESEE